MPEDISYTLLSDGSSDKALMPVIQWAIHQLNPTSIVQGKYADLARLRVPPRELADRISKTLDLYPCDLLFIHRDSEGERREDRKIEIDQAIRQIATKHTNLYTVAIIPIRMMEAWLLINEVAIKTAAGNPNGRYSVSLPNIKHLETLPDPKAILREHLRQASGLKGRQLDKFNVGRAVHLVAENIEDFSPLRKLNAYNAFENELITALQVIELNRS